ncbi:MAG: hypothetical protein LBN38_05780 [Verrucomicrobiota bacterium]|jgi:anti-anti-sigma regulatory factor|nr:hypothetical protein [Verrucomicrobiota bacterium]
MARSCPIQSRILAAVADDCTLVAVIGQGSFRLAAAFKQAAEAARLAGSPLIVVDMAKCISMDSTFMGALAALGFAVQKSSDTRLVLINVSPSAYNLLHGLGISRILKTYSIGAIPEGMGDLTPLVDNLKPVESAPCSAYEMAALMFDAHETLTRADPENLQRFKDVLAFLQEDLQRTES